MSSVKQLTLRQARTRRRLTQQQLERKSGVAQGIISRIENGYVSDPASSTLMKLAAALDMDPRVLRFGQRQTSDAPAA